MTATTLLTAEDLWETPEVPGTQFELVNGELVEMPTAGRFTTRSWCCVSHSRRPHQCRLGAH